MSHAESLSFIESTNLRLHLISFNQSNWKQKILPAVPRKYWQNTTKIHPALEAVKCSAPQLQCDRYCMGLAKSISGCTSSGRSYWINPFWTRQTGTSKRKNISTWPGTFCLAEIVQVGMTWSPKELGLWLQTKSSKGQTFSEGGASYLLEAREVDER